MNLNEVITGINPKCKFIPSFTGLKSEKPEFYFFLHIPKCGGIDLEMPFRYALGYKCSQSRERFIEYRADSEEPFRDFLATVYKNGIFQENANTCHGILSTHLGLKRLMREKICLDHMFTILRDPVDRILSAFGYQCMRQQETPDIGSLASFIKQPENQNQITQILDKGNSGIDELENYVRRSFIACVDVKESGRVLAELLARNELPNVLSENLNQTDPRFKVKKETLTETLIGKIEALNRRDIDFYARFKSSPLISDAALKGPINAISLVISDSRKAGEDLVSRMKIAGTKNLLDFLVANRGQLPDTLSDVMDMLEPKK